jgi:glycine/D-amino acid oxidase-like deaminating enzyme
VIGGGLAGLTATISCAEQGAAVVLHEAHTMLGGRARCTATPFIANDGTHAFYDGPPWRWLAARGLAQPAERLGVRQLTRLRIRHGGRLRSWCRGGRSSVVGAITGALQVLLRDHDPDPDLVRQRLRQAAAIALRP